MIIKDTTLQVFLTLYYGSLVGTFFYDYIIRNIVRMVQDNIKWDYLTNIGLGVLFIAVVVWLVWSLLAKIRTNLLISLVVLIVMFVVRCAIGIPEIYGFIFNFILFNLLLYIIIKKK